MKKVITYGTFDLFHEGHKRILERAKALGDYLIVGVTSQHYDIDRGKLNVTDSLMQRIENVKASGFVNEIIIEEYEGQKVDDIVRYKIDLFAIGSDWKGKFDYLNQYTEVVYLERTEGISSTMIRNNEEHCIKIGVVGCGLMANRFAKEAKYVSGHSLYSVYHPNLSKAEAFATHYEIPHAYEDYALFLESVQAVYIASCNEFHFEQAKEALLLGKHVLVEKPIVLSLAEFDELCMLAKQHSCVLIEAMKTAFCPGFNRLMNVVKSGLIGEIKSIEATMTQLVDENSREISEGHGSVIELASYPLMVINKIFQKPVKHVHFYTNKNKQGVDLFTKISLLYENGIASANVAVGYKSEGTLILTGSKGYVVVESPWWKTEAFEVRYEDFSKNKRYYYKFEGDGLRYEIAEFLDCIKNNQIFTSLNLDESRFVISLMEQFSSGNHVSEI